MKIRNRLVTGTITALQNLHFSSRKCVEFGNGEIVQAASWACATNGAHQKLHFHSGNRGGMGNREVAGIIVELHTSQHAQKAWAKAQDERGT